MNSNKLLINKIENWKKTLLGGSYAQQEDPHESEKRKDKKA